MGNMVGHRIWWRIIDPPDRAPKSATQELKQQHKRHEKWQWQRELKEEDHGLQ